MNKLTLLAQIIARLDETLDRLAGAARTAAADATDEHNRAENKYDTRATEASYLAAGQGRQALETADARKALMSLEPRAFAADEPIALGALIELRDAHETLWYFLGPSAGGTSVEHDGHEVLVATPASPLGQQLLGKRAGATLPGGMRITSVS